MPSAAIIAARVAEAHQSKKKKGKSQAQSDSDDELNQSGEKLREEQETSNSSSASAAPLRWTVELRKEVADKARKLDDAEQATESLDAALHKQDAINEKKVRELSEKRNSYPSEIEVNDLQFTFASLIP